MKEIIFEAEGITVEIEDGIVREFDDANVYEFEDTPQNRAACIEDAKRTVAEWARG